MKQILFKAKNKWQGNQYRKKLQEIVPQIPSEGIYVNYGNVLQNKSSPIIQGGKVKLTHLQKVFPENVECFNILYLVSSAQPPFAEVQIRWAKKHSVKFIWNQDGVAYPGWAGPNTKTQNETMSRLIHLADYVIYQSSFCRSSADRFLGPVSVPSEVLPNCVDLDLFSPTIESLPTTPWILLTAGTHQQPERVLKVLQAIAVLRERRKEARLILAGRLDWPKAEQQVKENIDLLNINNRVIYYPAFTQEDAPTLYRKAQVCIHAKYKDPCPTVVIEAMACGLPVVGSKSGGMPELIGEEGGILIDVPESWERMHYPSAEEMADAIELIFTDINGWRSKARKRAVEFFDKEEWIERHRKIFEMILTGRE